MKFSRAKLVGARVSRRPIWLRFCSRGAREGEREVQCFERERALFYQMGSISSRGRVPRGE